MQFVIILLMVVAAYYMFTFGMTLVGFCALKKAIREGDLSKLNGLDVHSLPQIEAVVKSGKKGFGLALVGFVLLVILLIVL